MLASAASLSWVPERIKKIFLTDELNKEGIIAVRFFIGGKPTVVVIDDAVPWKNKQRLMFAQTSEDNGSWIPYLEKAYAKFAGNYEKTAKGWMSESMRILTGAPSHRFNMRKMGNEELWALMVSAQENNYPMTLATQSTDYGLIAAHAYTLVRLHTLRDSLGNATERLVQLHNPWANEYYQGPWNDSDSKRWTDQYKAQVSHRFGENDGMFFMDLETFSKGFYFVTLTYIHDDFFYSFYERSESDS